MSGFKYFNGTGSGLKTKKLSFYSRGKLLITAEYLILLGARGLALPLQLGQRLEWLASADEYKGAGSGTHKTEIEWVTIVNGHKWFSAVFTGASYKVSDTTDNLRADYLRRIFLGAVELSGNKPLSGKVISTVEFNMEWGLGSSSSLISNIAYMFDVNPFALHFAVSRGSGYDIACARSNSPLIYRLEHQNGYIEPGNYPQIDPGSFAVPVYKEVDFNPTFSDRLYFAYSGRKKDSAVSVKRFFDQETPAGKNLEKVSQITIELTQATSIENFENLLREHDDILSSVLKEKPLNDTIFKDFPGYAKYLGAWGGDFLLLIWEGDVNELRELLEQKNINVVFPYKQLINIPDGGK